MKTAFFTIEKFINKDGTEGLVENTNGFSPYELVGILQSIQARVLEHIKEEQDYIGNMGNREMRN